MSAAVMSEAERGARVFVVQDDPSKNFVPAMAFGSVEVVLEAGSQVTFHAAPTVRRIRTALNKFRDGDFIVAVGDPVAIGIACAVAAERNDGRFSMLKWDRQEKRYYPVHVDMRGTNTP